LWGELTIGSANSAGNTSGAPGDLDGKVALVTGAGRLKGIGRAIALALAMAGADVVVHGSPRAPDQYSSDEKEHGWQGAKSVSDEIVGTGRRSIAFEADLTDRAAVKSMIDAASTELGDVDILVNNAGVSGSAGAKDILEVDDAEWDRTVDVNLNSVYTCCKLVLPGMLHKGGGSIVNISSLAGLRARARFGAYTATKFAVIGLTQQLALEFAPHVRVNCICPGSTDTDMMDGTFANWDRRLHAEPGTSRGALVARIPLGRQGMPAEVASSVRFLASEAASFITGETLRVDGGGFLV
jgi:NAD(P)-dependent dehydrogenase (short-subunit alcohol dehydrogenase family)